MLVKIYHLIIMQGPYFIGTIPISVFYIICTYNGNLHSPDSEFYLFISNHLLETGTLSTPGGNPVIYWPPLYILAIIPDSFVPNYILGFHLALLVTHQLLWINIFSLYLRDSTRLIFYSIILGLNTLTLMVAIYIWSEIFFMVLFAVFILLLLKYADQRRNIQLIGAGFSLFLCLLTRNAGVFFLPGLMIFGLISLEKSVWPKFLIMFVLAASGNFFWNVHRIFILDHPEALTNLIPKISILRNINLTLSEIGYNFLPRQFPNWSVSILIAALLIMIVARRMTFLTDSSLLVLVLLSYLLFWFIIPSDFDNMGRFLAPVSPIFMIIILEGGYNLLKTRANRFFFSFVGYYLLLYSLLRMAKNTLVWIGAW